MDRLACISVPALPLQLLLGREPGWAEDPVAVVENDRPQGRILWINERAYASAVRRGMSFAQGLSLARGLRAAVVGADEIGRGVARMAAVLRRYSPAVEPSTDDPGVFWLDASGLSPLFSSATAWARAALEALTAEGVRASAAVGFSRFGTYAAARSASGRGQARVFRTPHEEEQALRRVRLDRLGLDPSLVATLDRLDVATVGDFLGLPAAGLHKRFGAEAARLSALAAGDLFDPLRPIVPDEPARSVIQLEPPDGDAVRLLFAVKRHLHPLLAGLAARGQALESLTIAFDLERADPRTDELRPAAPTLDQALVVELVRLRLESKPLAAAAQEIVLTAEATRATREQLQLFFTAPPRDLAAANRALARVRAMLGDEAVVRARPVDGHLPEARFAWEPLAEIPAAAVATRPAVAGGGDDPPLAMVRRIHARPVPLPPRPHPEPTRKLVKHLGGGPVLDLWGPYVVSGGWWRGEVSRRYFFASVQRGDLLWLYYDARRRKWMMQGAVE